MRIFGKAKSVWRALALSVDRIEMTMFCWKSRSITLASEANLSSGRKVICTAAKR